MEAVKKVEALGTTFDVNDVDVSPAISSQEIPLEERVYWANAQRRSYGLHSGERSSARNDQWLSWFENRFGPETHDNPLDINNHITIANEKQDQLLDRMTEYKRDKAEARRALRTSSWAAVFFLIVTDVIGPFNAPYGISQMGLIGGIFLYVTFGVAAYYSSFLIMNLYLRLDSDRYPVRNWGELAQVFYGKFGHYLVAAIQIVQISFIVASNTIVNANGMTELTQNRDSGPLCYIDSIIIWTVIGLVISLPFLRFSHLSVICSLNMVVNVIIICLSMGFIAHSPPNYDAAAAAYGYTPPYAPIEVSATGVPSLSDQINGADNMIFGWTGAMVFVELLNEMRRPYEFWKSFTVAEIFILVVYVTYGVYVYALQGQYTLPVAFQGVSNYTWQSIGNGLSLWTYVMASVLYMNVAVKSAYWWIVEDIFHGPSIHSRFGWFMWVVLQISFWWLSFVIGTAIPQVQTIQGLTAALFLLQFSYTWPPLFQLTFDVHADASKEDPVFVPGQAPRRIDSWRQMSRWRRGLFTGRVYFKAFNLVYVLASLSLSGLGTWGAIETIISTFQTSQATSFGCAAPV